MNLPVLKFPSITENHRYYKWHMRKVGPETRVLWWDTRSETRIQVMAGTRNPRPGTRDPKPWTYLKDRTQDPRPLVYVEPET